MKKRNLVFNLMGEISKIYMFNLYYEIAELKEEVLPLVWFMFYFVKYFVFQRKANIAAEITK